MTTHASDVSTSRGPPDRRQRHVRSFRRGRSSGRRQSTTRASGAAAVIQGHRLRFLSTVSIMSDVSMLRLRAHRSLAWNSMTTVNVAMNVPTSRAIAFAVTGPISRADLPGLCGRICALLERSDAQIAFCDVRSVDPDAVTVDALARLQLDPGSCRCPGSLAPCLDGVARAAHVHGALRRPARVTDPSPRAGPAGRTAERACRCRERTIEIDDSAMIDLEDLEGRAQPSPVSPASHAGRTRGSRSRPVSGSRASRDGRRQAPPPENVIPSPEPKIEGRHRLRRVLVDQRRHVHVVALEGLDVPGEQFALCRSELRLG